MDRIILDIGCGRRKHAGAIGVDNAALDTVDVMADLRNLPLPFATGSADEIILSHVLEHFGIEDIQRILDEAYRVLQATGVVTISVPHALSVAFSVDPTHKTRFTFATWQYFSQGHAFDYYQDLNQRWRVEQLWASVNLFNNTLTTVPPWQQKLESYVTRGMRYLVRRSRSQTLPDLVVKQFPFWLVNIHCRLAKADAPA